MLDRDNITDLCQFYHPDTSFDAYLSFLKGKNYQQQWDKRQKKIKRNQVFKQFEMAPSQIEKNNIMAKYYVEQAKSQFEQQEAEQKRIQHQISKTEKSISTYILNQQQSKQIEAAKKGFLIQLFGVSAGIMTVATFWKRIPGLSILRLPLIVRLFLASGLIGYSYIEIENNLTLNARALIGQNFEKNKSAFQRFVQNGDVTQLIPNIQLI